MNGSANQRHISAVTQRNTLGRQRENQKVEWVMCAFGAVPVKRNRGAGAIRSFRNGKTGSSVADIAHEFETLMSPHAILISTIRIFDS